MWLYIDAKEHELGDLGKLANYKAILLDLESKKWLDAMNVEMQSMKDNDVWELVELPPNARTIGSKWLFKKKTDMDGAIHTFKAHLVAKGFTQTYEVDCEEIFSPVVDIRVIRILISIVVCYDYKIWQMDVKTAFLNGHLYEEVYMMQPEGFVNPKYPNCVCKLNRSIYGLKKASKQWNKRFDDEIKKLCFTQNSDEPCVYLKASKSYVTFLIMYVDDILIMGNNIPMLQDVKSYLGRCFAMKDLGEAAYILGIKIYRDRLKLLIGSCQSAYIEEILKRYFMENPKHGTIPMQDKLKLSKSHGASTPAELGLWYPKDSPFNLVAYTDSDYVGASLDRKSTTGGFQFLGCRLISWQCKKHTVVANSTTKAEYIATSNCCRQIERIVLVNVARHKLTIAGSVNAIRFNLMLLVQVNAVEDIGPSRWKKVIVTETSVRRALHLKDVEGIDCLPTATIFAKLERIGAKTTVWNEFSSNMASAIIYLSANQKFNFSKYIFDNMVKNLEGGVKFLMYPRFVQVFLDKHVEGMSKHKEMYVTPSHTKKVFANMKRQGKDFFGRDTPLFPTMMVQAPQEEVEGSDIHTDPHPTPSITQPSSSQPHKKQKLMRKQRKGTEIPSSSGEPVADEAATKENVPTHSIDLLLSGEDRLQLNELILKQRVKKLEKKKKSIPHGLRRLYKVGRSRRVESSKESFGDQEDASKQGRKIANLDVDAEVTLIDETQGRNDKDLMFDTGVLDEQEVEVKKVEKVTLIEIKAAKPKVVTTAATITTTTVTIPKARGVVVQEPSEFTTTTSPSQPSQLSQAKDKGKEKMVEPEKPLKKKDQIMFDKEVAQKLQAKLDAELEEEEKLAKQKKRCKHC
ncbi:retrotransposon protein, putative, ty1-copia subclass [Tanacetum coccineum]